MSGPQRNKKFPEEIVGMWKWEWRRTISRPGPEELVLCEGKIRNKIQPPLERRGKENPWGRAYLSSERSNGLRWS